MEKRVSITTAATTEPVDAAYIKLHCRIDVDEDDAWISQRITAARKWCEKFTGKTFARAQYTLYCGSFYDDDENFLYLPKGPVSEITSVGYRSVGSPSSYTSNSTQFVVETDEAGGSRLRFKYGETVPAVADAWDAVKVIYWTGPADGSETDVDERVRQTIALVVGHWYKNRESTTMDVPESVQSSARGLLWDLVSTEC